MSFEVLALDHVQLAMPPGGEADAEAFYCGLLGFTRVPKPMPLAARGGCWFERGPVKLHLGAEQDFRAAKKAHPALVVRGLDELVARLEAAMVPIRPDDELPGVKRVHIEDPFGNRIELVSAD